MTALGAQAARETCVSSLAEPGAYPFKRVTKAYLNEVNRIKVPAVRRATGWQ